MRGHLNDKLSIFLFSIALLIMGYMSYAYITGQFETHTFWVNAVDTNKEGMVISASENELLLWENRKCISRLYGHTEAIKTVAFSKSGEQFASGSIDKSIVIWSLPDKKVIKKLNGHSKGVNNIEFSHSDQYLVSAGYDDKLIIWDWVNAVAVKELNIKHTHFSINRQDVLAYIDSSCVLTLFDLKSLSTIKAVGHFCGSPLFCPQHNILAVYDSTFIFIDLNSNKVLSTLNIQKENSSSKVSAFTFTPDGRYMAAGIWGGDIEIWDWQQKKELRVLQGHRLNSVEELTVNAKNELISASGDQSLKFWNWQTGDLKMVIGDGLFLTKLSGLLSTFIMLTLLSSFWALKKSNTNIFSNYCILTILTLWSLGTGLFLYFFRATLTKYAASIAWTATVFSILFVISMWYSWLSIFTIPVALFFCYIKMITDNDKYAIYIPLIINLLFCGMIWANSIEAALDL